MNRLPKTIARAAALGLVCALAACSSTPRGSQNRYEGGEGQHQMNAVEGNEVLARSLQIKNPRSRRTADGRMQVQFDLENSRSTRADFAWAVDWFDQSGFKVQDNTRHWEPAALGGYGITTLSITAPTPAASSWKLQISSRDEVK